VKDVSVFINLSFPQLLLVILKPAKAEGSRIVVKLFCPVGILCCTQDDKTEQTSTMARRFSLKDTFVQADNQKVLPTANQHL
jgi:hypothetical protein